MAAKGPRENIILECTECKNRNYMTSKNKRNNTDRLELVKYCKFCKKRTTHKENDPKFPLWLHFSWNWMPGRILSTWSRIRKSALP